MARYGLENDTIRIEIDSHGAELKSLVKKETGTEYMWCADPKYWGRTSPVLFPLVGNVSGKQYRTKGKTYDMGQHGFARDMEFTLESQTENEIWFVLHSNEETYAKYPYVFTLKLGYRLTGTKVDVLWHVENLSDEEMPFAIGGHPAFCCPINKTEKQSDCYLKFDVAGPIESETIDGYLVGDKTQSYDLKDGKIRIDEHMFDNDALIFAKQGIKKLHYAMQKEKRILRSRWMHRFLACGDRRIRAHRLSVSSLGMAEAIGSVIAENFVTVNMRM